MSPEPHRANPAFGTIAILKGNLASGQVPFFRENGPSGYIGPGFFLEVPVILIREETETDVPAIRRMNEEAFGQPMEADIVDRIRASCDLRRARTWVRPSRRAMSAWSSLSAMDQPWGVAG